MPGSSLRLAALAAVLLWLVSLVAATPAPRSSVVLQPAVSAAKDAVGMETHKSDRVTTLSLQPAKEWRLTFAAEHTISHRSLLDADGWGKAMHELELAYTYRPTQDDAEAEHELQLFVSFSNHSVCSFSSSI
jgi:hypothetical protein